MHAATQLQNRENTAQWNKHNTKPSLEQQLMILTHFVGKLIEQAGHMHKPV